MKTIGKALKSIGKSVITEIPCSPLEMGLMASFSAFLVDVLDYKLTGKKNMRVTDEERRMIHEFRKSKEKEFSEK